MFMNMIVIKTASQAESKGLIKVLNCQDCNYQGCLEVSHISIVDLFPAVGLSIFFYQSLFSFFFTCAQNNLGGERLGK